jgi:hypothetical protein
MITINLPLPTLPDCYWHEAQQACQQFSEDGLTLSPTPQHIWRLPNEDEAVRSMARHGENSGGVYEEENARPPIKRPPIKSLLCGISIPGDLLVDGNRGR